MKKLLATMLALVMALTLCATAWADSVFTNGVATVDNETDLKAALAEAKTATEPVTIDLNGARYAVNGFARDADAYIHIEANVTLKNGTFDVTGANCGDGFSGIISIREDAAVTFENVAFTGNEYKSAAGVIAITDIPGVDHFCTLTLKECSFNLKNEQAAGAASIIYGTGINNCKVVIDNCTFTLENTNRIFLQMTIDMKESSLTDTTTNGSAEHAFRNVAGEIKNSTVSITGTHETGIKNSAGAELKITGSDVTLNGARSGDLVLEGNATVAPNGASNLMYTTASENIVTLTLHDNHSNSLITKVHVVANNEVDLADYTPTKTGYTFGTWVNTNDGKTYSGKIDLSDDLTLSATWNNNVYSINYELDGGTNADTNPATYTYDEGVTSFANPTKTGFTFKGWKNGDTVVTSISDTATGDITLTATWQRNQNRNPSSTTTTTTTTTVTKAESPKTFDAGIAVYGVMAISSVLGMGYMGKKKV